MMESKMRVRWVVGVLITVLVAAAFTLRRPPARTVTPAAFGKVPLYFVENRGQLNGPVDYYVQGRDTSVYFGSSGVTFALSRRKARPRLASWTSLPERPQEAQRWAVKLDFIGANPGVKPVGENRTAAVVSYFQGRASQWKTALPTYSKIVYGELWPGVDLAYSGTVNRLKYDFVVQPGAGVEQIRLGYRGATGVRVNEVGQLEVSTPVGGFRDEKPYAYQDIGGRRVEVEAAYELEGGNYGFRVGPYDRKRPLILDPAVLVYAGYIGGGGEEAGNGIAVDAAGNAYVTGYTSSIAASFPITAGPDLTYNGGYDALVAKVNAAGTALIYAGYIGGAGYDEGFSIAVDGTGNAYVAGYTESTGATFPATGGPDLVHNGGLDAFVAKVNAAGTALVYAGYIGGAGGDVATGIALDPAGNAYVTGYTDSTQATFPVTAGPKLTHNGGIDAFVAKVNAGGTALVYGGYIGGAGIDVGNGIAVDGTGNAYITGYTTSPAATFPVTVGPDLIFNGNLDAFVAKVNAAGMDLVYAGYIGGSGDDLGQGIAVDAAGSAYVTGYSTSTEATFPVTSGPDLTYNGSADAFVAKLNPAGTVLVYAGYIGGANSDAGYAIALDGAGNAYVAGYTSSSEATFPVTGGPDSSYNGGGIDAFAVRVNAAGTALAYAGYIGGAGAEEGRGIAVDAVGNAYVTGVTYSTEATFPVTTGPGLTFRGIADAFVAKVGRPPTAVSVTPASGSGSGGSFAFRFSDQNGSGDLAWVQMLFNSTLTLAGGCYLNYTPSTNKILLRDDAGTGWLGPATLGSGAVLENSLCKVTPAASSAAAAGDNLTVTLALLFKAPFAGTKNIYMKAKDNGGLVLSWQSRGTWTVAASGNLAPSAVSVTPGSGSGSTQTFGFLFSDPNGYGDLAWTQMVVNGSLSAVNGCYLNYSPGANKVWLLNDASTVWLGPVVLGSAAVVENSQCRVNPAASSTLRSGANLTVNFSISFKPAFNGLKKVYMQTKDNGGLGTGWQPRGTWTVP
jgi:hypothetical protein